jgi:hypothetical protein
VSRYSARGKLAKDSEESTKPKEIKRPMGKLENIILHAMNEGGKGRRGRYLPEAQQML